MTDEIQLSRAEREMGVLTQTFITAYAVEQVQGAPLTPTQVEEFFSAYMANVLDWRSEYLEDRTGPLTLLDFAIYTLFQLLGSVVSLSLLLHEANGMLSTTDVMKLALRSSTRDYAQKAADRMEKALG